MNNLNINQKITKDYLNGISKLQISKNYKVGTRLISKILNESKIKIRTRKETNTRYYFNHDFFEKINCEEKAYFLGFLLADGYISPNLVSLELKDIDEHILKKFILVTENTNNVKKYKRRGSCGNTNTAKITFRSDKMVKDLNNLGLHRNKTYNLVVPKIDESLEKHFWRGVLDGDGYISCYTPKTKRKLVCGEVKVYVCKKQIQTGICGHLNTMNAFVDFLKRNNIETVGVRPDHSIFRVKIKTKDTIKFLNLIYSEANPELFLKRKYAKYQEYLEYKKGQ